MEMELLKPSTSVTLNAADLSFASASITSADGKIMNATASVNADAQTVTFTFPKHLPAGNYRIDIDYSGKIYKHDAGLFALDYEEAGNKKRALFTHFEAATARHVFPRGY